jgi:hypothetical protein
MTDPSAAELHERLRLIALEMHGLDGYADSCEDAGDEDDAAQVRAILRKMRALIPETADPAALTFAWGVRFTSKNGRHTHMPAADEADARDALDFHREGVAPGNQYRYQLCRRVIGGWEAVDA